MSWQSAHKFQLCGRLEKSVSEARVTLQSLVGQRNLVYWKGTLQFKPATPQPAHCSATGNLPWQHSDQHTWSTQVFACI